MQSKDHYEYEKIAKAFENGDILTTNKKPEASVARKQLAILIHRAKKVKPIKTETKNHSIVVNSLQRKLDLVTVQHLGKQCKKEAFGIKKELDTLAQQRESAEEKHTSFKFVQDALNKFR